MDKKYKKKLLETIEATEAERALVEAGLKAGLPVRDETPFEEYRDTLAEFISIGRRIAETDEIILKTLKN